MTAKMITVALCLLPSAIMAFAPFTTIPSNRIIRLHQQRQIMPTALGATQSEEEDDREKDLTAEQLRALNVFNEVIDSSPDRIIGPNELSAMLTSLDIDASEEESLALFKYLDVDESGYISFYDEFLPWYDEVALSSTQSAQDFQEIIMSRRTVHEFDDTPVDDEVLKRAIECAIAAPNRLQTEPWRFVSLGPDTISKVETLQKDMMSRTEGSFVKFTNIPGWLVVTNKISPDDPLQEIEDFKSTCCAVQNLMLSLWSEGIGSKWTSGPVQRTGEFADLCGVDESKEKVLGVIWYGFASGGLKNVEGKCREKGVEDVLSFLP